MAEKAGAQPPYIFHLLLFIFVGGFRGLLGMLAMGGPSLAALLLLAIPSAISHAIPNAALSLFDWWLKSRSIPTWLRFLIILFGPAAVTSAWLAIGLGAAWMKAGMPTLDAHLGDPIRITLLTLVGGLPACLLVAVIVAKFWPSATASVSSSTGPVPEA